MTAQGGVKLVKVYDNLAGRDGLATGWGLSVWIEAGEKVTLFDTGGDGHKLVGNLATLGLEPSRISRVVLSHLHADHTGGLPALLKTIGGVELIVPQRLSDRDVAALEAMGCRIAVAHDGPMKIDHGLFSTGRLGEFLPEQSLVIASGQGPVVLTGCAHPGLEPILDAARDVLPGPGIHLLAGGLHLLDSQAGQKEAVIKLLRDRGVRRIAPSHCTGQLFMRTLAEAFGPDFIDFGCGRVILLEERE